MVNRRDPSELSCHHLSTGEEAVKCMTDYCANFDVYRKCCGDLSLAFSLSLILKFGAGSDSNKPKKGGTNDFG